MLVRTSCIAAAVALVAPAGAAARTCGKTASIVTGAVDLAATDWTWTDETGDTLEKAVQVEVNQPAGATLDRRHLYTATSDVTLRFGKQTFKLTSGSHFNLQCWGESQAAGAIHPSVGLLAGSVTATGTRVGILTSEGLFNPHGPVRQTIKATRTAAKGTMTYSGLASFSPR